MSTQDNKALVSRYFEEILNAANIAAIHELVAAAWIGHWQAGDVHGSAELLQHITGFHTAYSGGSFTFEDQTAEGDKVVVRYTMHGIYRSGNPNNPTSAIGKRVTLMGIGIYRIANGKIVEEWATWDGLGWQQQLGLITEENKAIVRHITDELFNKGNMAVADELVAPNFISHTGFPGQGSGAEGFKYAAAIVRGAFPDFHTTVEDAIAEGDRVMVRASGAGTHQGKLQGIPPTGKRVTMTTIDIYRLAGGKIVEHWNLTDNLNLMQQLGVIPAPSQPPAG